MGAALAQAQMVAGHNHNLARLVEADAAVVLVRLEQQLLVHAHLQHRLVQVRHQHLVRASERACVRVKGCEPSGFRVGGLGPSGFRVGGLGLRAIRQGTGLRANGAKCTGPLSPF